MGQILQGNGTGDHYCCIDFHVADLCQIRAWYYVEKGDA